MRHEVDVPELEICLFGGCDVRADGKPVPLSRKMGWLLARLTLARGAAVERLSLARALWPDAEEDEDKRNSLKTTLLALESRLPKGCLEKTKETAFLKLADVTVDVFAFDEAILRGDVDSLKQAVDDYRGQLLDGCDQAWILQERLRRETLCLKAIQRLVAFTRETEDDGALAQYQQRAVELLTYSLSRQPCSQAAARAVMRAHVESGDYSGAESVFLSLRTRLNERRIPLEPETTSLFDRLRAEGRALAQTVRPDVKFGAPPVTPPHNLPQPCSHLIGREKDCLEIRTSLRTERCVILTGAGGMGKTQLAIHVAWNVLDHFADGVWFVDLQEAMEAEQVPQAIARALSIRETPGQPLSRTLTDWVQERSLLLVLDNCEQVVEACAQLAHTLLKAASRLKILATSRERLNIPEEIPWRVPSLSLPERESRPLSLRVLSDFGATRLFLERAGTGAVAEQDAPLVSEICHLLDGVPLAIELAAARAREGDLSELAGDLRRSYRLLNRSYRTAPSRQKTLEACIDWSYQPLTEAEQQLLRHLSVFAGGCTFAAIQVVCADSVATRTGLHDLLTALVDKSLVSYQARTSRYRLLETIRQFSEERLHESGEAQEVYGRHRDHFLHGATAAARLSFAEQAAGLQRLEEEHDNLRVALRTCLEDPEGGPGGLRLALAMGRFWDIRGHLSEGRRWFAAVLGHAGAQEPTRERANALTGAGFLAGVEGDFERSSGLFTEAAAIQRALGDHEGLGATLTGLSGNTTCAQDYERARLLGLEAQGIYRALGDRRGEASAALRLGSICLYQGDMARAGAFYEQTRDLSVVAGDERLRIYALGGLGRVALRRRDAEEAGTHLLQCLQLCRSMGEHFFTASTLEGLAQCSLLRDDLERAATLLGAAGALRARLNVACLPKIQEEIEWQVRSARAGMAPETFEAAWNAGWSFTWEGAIRFALCGSDDTPPA